MKVFEKYKIQIFFIYKNNDTVAINHYSRFKTKIPPDFQIFLNDYNSKMITKIPNIKIKLCYNN